MTPLPNYRPKQLSLGPLEAEILNLIWELGSATGMCMNILATQTGVSLYFRNHGATSPHRVGWCDKKGVQWRPMVTKQQAQVLKAHEQLHRFLAGATQIVAGIRR